MAAKWNGKSVHQLNQKEQRIKNLGMAVQELSRLHREAEMDYLKELARIVDREPGSIMTGSWECEGSPTKHCIYEFAIGADDECLFCGAPNERK